MKYTIEIDDRSKTAKNLIGIIEDLSKTSKNIKFISEKDEDKKLLARMKESLASGVLSEKESAGLIKKIMKDAK
ncbi:MAG: hypothetical protein NTX03_04015 [Bacteroidetes bacterium]|nr:hypothetical protein [Bacteroidota bacterium]